MDSGLSPDQLLDVRKHALAKLLVEVAESAIQEEQDGEQFLVANADLMMRLRQFMAWVMPTNSFEPSFSLQALISLNEFVPQVAGHLKERTDALQECVQDAMAIALVNAKIEELRAVKMV